MSRGEWEDQDQGVGTVMTPTRNIEVDKLDGEALEDRPKRGIMSHDLCWSSSTETGPTIPPVRILMVIHDDGEPFLRTRFPECWWKDHLEVGER